MHPPPPFFFIKNTSICFKLFFVLILCLNLSNALDVNLIKKSIFPVTFSEYLQALYKQDIEKQSEFQSLYSKLQEKYHKNKLFISTGSIADFYYALIFPMDIYRLINIRMSYEYFLGNSQNHSIRLYGYLSDHLYDYNLFSYNLFSGGLILDLDYFYHFNIHHSIGINIPYLGGLYGYAIKNQFYFEYSHYVNYGSYRLNRSIRYIRPIFSQFYYNYHFLNTELTLSIRSIFNTTFNELKLQYFIFLSYQI